MNKPIPVTFTPDELHKLFYVGEDMDNTQEHIAKCEAIADMLSEAMESLDGKGQTPRNGIIRNIADVILDYSRNAATAMNGACKQFGSLYSAKRNEAYGEAVNGNE